MRRVFITGGAGFIGSSLVSHLVEDNEVVVFDNMSRGSPVELSEAGHRNLQIVQGDVLDRDALEAAMMGSNFVIHCAGVAGIDTVIKSPTKTMQVNMIGSANVLEMAKNLSDCERVVCFSTSEVFGETAFMSAESDRTVIGALGEARWTYAVSKLAEEHLAIAYFKEFGLPATVVRPFNIYGPGQIGEGALRTFVQRAIRNQPLEIHGDGTQIRAWCYIDDMIEAVVRTLRDPAAVGESFNIGNSRSVETIYGLANTVIRVLKSNSPIEFVRRDMADVELRVPSVAKARQLLNFEAKIGLEDGILRTAEYYSRSLV